MIRFERDHTCVWLPPDSDALQTGPPPAVLFLHGIGERGNGGDDLHLVRRWGLPKLRSTTASHQHNPVMAPVFPFLVLAPQCPADARWCDADVLQALDDLLDAVIAG
ncbi:MAG TPA: hypothetical protein VES39_09050, partial [Rhodospirillales bacterium]|nr:hypothetical protein [Rhodospirillales bacterium]